MSISQHKTLNQQLHLGERNQYNLYIIKQHAHQTIQLLIKKGGQEQHDHIRSMTKHILPVVLYRDRDKIHIVSI